MSKHLRLESTLQRALSEIFMRDIKDKSIGFITITEVRLTRDLSYLTVYYTILGKDTKKEAAKKAIDRSKAFIRTTLAHKVKMRKSPSLVFKYDESLDYGNRIEQGLKSLHKDDKKS